MVIAGAGFLGIWTKKFLVTFQVAGSFIHSNICDDKLGPKHSYSPISKALQYQISKHSYSPISRVNVSETTKLSPSKINFKVQICCSMKALQVPGTGLSYYLAWCAIAADSFLFGSEDVKIQRASQQPGTKVAICIERISCHQKSLNIAWPQCLREACESSGCSWGTGGSHRLSWWCLQAQTWCHPQLSVSAQCLGSPATGLEPITSTDSCHLLLPNTTKKCTCKCKYQLQIILPVVILLQ